MQKTNLTATALGVLARRVLSVAALPLLACASASAATYTWDPGLTGTGSDGAGTWSEATANWATGTGNILWPAASTDTASFGVGGTPGLVTVSGGVSVGDISFSSAYTVAGGTITVGATPTITTVADAVFTSAITGASTTLTKAGAAKLTINGLTTGISAINVTAGILSTGATGSASFGDGATALVVSSGAAIQVAPGANATNPITFNGGSGASAYIGGATLSGPITLAADDTKINANNVATISGPIGGPGSLTLSGPNKLTLSGANTYSGGTTLLDGVLEVASGGTLGTGAVANGTTLEINPSFGDTVTLPNTITGAGSITKSGEGTAVLSGPVSTTGFTIVSQGKLLIDGTKSGSGSVVYVGGTGAVLGGTGTITGATSGTITLLSGGGLAPGDDGIGTLSATSISWTSNNTDASMFFDLSTTDSTSDLLALTGAFSRASTSGSYIFDFGGTGQEWTTYTLITYGSISSTNLTNLVGINTPFPTHFSLSGNSLKVTVVPEPSQVGFAFAAFAVLAILMRRHRGSVTEIFKAIMNKQMVKNAPRAMVIIALAALGMQSAGAKTITVKLETATFDDLQAAMNAGVTSSVELATLYLNRRAVYDQAGIKINSVVAINPNLMDDAADQDALRSEGTLLGPLQGLVFCTKDSYPTVGMVTSGGVKAWLSSTTGVVGTGTATSPITTEGGVTYGPVIAPSDCWVPAKLKAAGAVQLGHGNMDTWATSASSTTSNAYGTTLNAYCLGSASGSSGGPGAMTGSDFSNFAWGGETGGSIRNPSDRAGVTGFKVSVGTNSVNNIIPLASDRDVVGPMSRYVKDEAYIMDAAATEIDPSDLWAPINYVPGRGLSNGYAAKLASASLAGKVIGVVGTYLGTPRPVPAPTPVQLTDSDVEKALGVGNGHGGILNFGTSTNSDTTGTNANDAAVLAAHNRLVTELQSLGATVVTVFLPPNCDTAVTIPTKFTDNTSTPTAALNGNNPDVTSITGITTTTATYASTTLAFENRGFQLFHNQGIYTRLTQANAASSSLSTAVRGLAYDNKATDFTVPAAVTHFQLKAIYNAIYEKFMDTAGPGGTPLDCLIWPVSYSKNRSSNSVAGRDLVNNMGLPVCTVPIGVYNSLGGEPIDEAFLGRYRKEADVLALAGAYQRGYNHRIPSSLSPPLAGETFTYTTGGTIFSQRSDKLAPVVSIKTKATVKGDKVIINGIADDASGIGSLKVYVNGRKIASKSGKHWTASVSLSDIKKWTKTKGKTFDVTVFAKDGAGNASATVKPVKI